MAQKAAKSLAQRNTTRLSQTHLITLGLHLLFLFMAFLIRRSLSLKPYILLSIIPLVLEFYLDKLGRPVFAADGTLRKAGEDLDARGLTEFMWDVIYWSWINLGLVMLLGNRLWWLWLVVPGYASYMAFGAARGVKGMLGGLGGAAGDGAMGSQDGMNSTTGESKRQKKMEKRGGQKVSYR